MNNVPRNCSSRHFFENGNKVFHKKHGLGIVKRSWYGFTYLVDWYFGESSKHAAQTLILISESDEIY